jgi:NAD(P)H-dependent flavin oxidoreductase YrpB (nitropropane dioxygenase family)
MFLKNIIEQMMISGQEVFPIIEGGKGIGVSNGMSAGSFAAAGGIGTFSGVNAENIDKDGKVVPLVYRGKTRNERHEELMQYSIKGAVDQAKIAYEIASGKGRIHMNVLWEMAGAERILHEVLEQAKGLIHGITCGAGMPYKLAPIAEKYKIYYYPIVSSMRAFRALWKRSYSKYVKNLGGVVYEDPWKAGGHNGLSNAEDPEVFQPAYPRIVEIRKFMNEVGLQEVPIVMAGGVWNLEEYKDWLDNPEIGKIVFQLGTRPVVTQESPVPKAWKLKLLNLKEGDVYLNRFSPTGFYSSAVENSFIKELQGREKRQVAFAAKADAEFNREFAYGARGRKIHIKEEDEASVKSWVASGYSEIMKTPDNTVIFVTKEKEQEIHKDQVDCMGCLSACRFSNWMTDAERNFTTGRKPDPRSFCIQKTLTDIVQGADIDHELMFAGHNAYRFASDPLYKNNYIPTVQELMDNLVVGK